MRLVLLVWLGSRKCGGGGRDTGKITATNWGRGIDRSWNTQENMSCRPNTVFPPPTCERRKIFSLSTRKNTGRKQIILRQIRAIVDVELKKFQPKYGPKKNYWAEKKYSKACRPSLILLYLTRADARASGCHLDIRSTDRSLSGLYDNLVLAVAAALKLRSLCVLTSTSVPAPSRFIVLRRLFGGDEVRTREETNNGK